MRPIVVWENMGREMASTTQTIPKARMPFNGECIAASNWWIERFLGPDTYTTEFGFCSEPSAIGRYTLTRSTSQVVSWSDHKTASLPETAGLGLDILGHWLPQLESRESIMAIATINPATGEVVNTFEPLN